MRRYTAGRVAALVTHDLCGYVLKKNSPSCGMERVKIYGRSGPVASGRGVFAEALLQAFPHLPVEEEGRLNDPRLRENFVERVFAYRRLRSLLNGRWTIVAWWPSTPRTSCSSWRIRHDCTPSSDAWWRVRKGWRVRRSAHRMRRSS